MKLAALLAIAAMSATVLSAARGGTARMLIAQAPSTDRVFPRGGTDFRSLAPADAVEVSLARNERECVQIAVTPGHGMALTNVRIVATDLVSARGVRLAASNVSCDVVGFVKTRHESRFAYLQTDGSRAKYPAGLWWPDPLLGFLGGVDVAAGDIQSFWIRVACPAGQPPGRYYGALVVSADGVAAQEVPFAVRVYGFTLSRTSTLPIAVTFSPGPSAAEEGAKVADDDPVRTDPKSPLNAWRAHEDEWTDFLADYFIMPDNLYIAGARRPRFAQLKRLMAQGRLGWFNLRYWGHVNRPLDEWIRRNMPLFREAYDTAKSEGLLGHAYFYGCDELATNLYGAVSAAAGELKRAFLDVPVMTTTSDKSLGLAKDGIRNVDVFVVYTPNYDTVQADRARAAGKKVWWYIACLPGPPWANAYIENPPIDLRMLMGAQAVRMKPDGFLYYQTSIWNSARPIESGPFTDWDPRSFLWFNGDGSWTRCGPGGRPVATQRLENFRDGVEDHAYVDILAGKLKARPDAPWAPRARRLLEVPSSVMISMTNFTHSASDVYAWRNAVAELIEEEE